MTVKHVLIFDEDARRRQRHHRDDRRHRHRHRSRSSSRSRSNSPSRRPDFKHDKVNTRGYYYDRHGDRVKFEVKSAKQIMKEEEEERYRKRREDREKRRESTRRHERHYRHTRDHPNYHPSLPKEAITARNHIHIFHKESEEVREDDAYESAKVVLDKLGVKNGTVYHAFH